MADRSLLPPNASPLERRLTEIMGRLGDIPSPLRELMQPDTCPIELLPWLAWHLGVDAWKDYWPEEVKRARVKAAIPIARQNGTAAAVRGVIAAFGADIALREWWQLTPPGPPQPQIWLDMAARVSSDRPMARPTSLTARLPR